MRAPRTYLPVAVMVVLALAAFGCGGDEVSPTASTAMASFTFSLASSCLDRVELFLDGASLGFVAPGESKTFTAPAGDHVLRCVPTSGAPANITVTLGGGVTMRVSAGCAGDTLQLTTS